MKKTLNKLIWLAHIWLLVGVAAIISGCQTTGSSASEEKIIYVNNDEGGQTVSFDVRSNAILQQVIAPQSSSQQSAVLNSTQASSLQTYSGTLTITDGASTIGPYAITASINSSTWQVELQQTFVIPTGSYTFYVLLNHVDTQYAGQASYTVTADQNNIVTMIVAPVIGDSVVQVETISQLGSYKFYYSGIPDLAFFEPQLGVVVDGGNEHLFQVDGTGLTETYLNLTPGDHTVELKLYDGTQQKGTSIPAQENQTITIGQTISMDLIPLYGVTNHAISVTGSDATFDIEIPTEIITQADGLSNLKVTYIMNGAGTNYTPIEGEIDSLTYDSSLDAYTGEFSQSGAFFAATLNLYISFIKEAEDELIGTCIIQTSLNASERSSLCSIPVVNSLIATGDILGTVGITVCEDNGEGGCGASVSAASVYTLDSENGDELLGLTGSDLGGSEGLLKTNLKAGEYTIRAVNSGDGRFGETTFSLAALEVENVEVVLNASAPTNPSIVINGGNPFTYSRNISLALAAEDSVGITGYYVSNDGTAPGEGDWIAANSSQNFQTTISFQLTENTGLKTVYAWYKNAGGHRSERVQASITVQDDTSLYIDNFEFTSTEVDPVGDGRTPDSYCADINTELTYRIVDWNEIEAIINQNDTVNTDSLKTGSISPSDGVEFFNNWFGNAPTGAFISYNNNLQFNSQYYAVSEPSNASRDTFFGWNSLSNVVTDAAGDLQLYTVESNQTAYVLCYRDDGVHPLVNGDFSQDRDFWPSIQGSSEVINEAMVVQTTTEAVSYSRVEQNKIAVKPGQTYRITFQAKTSLETLTLTAGIIGGDITAASYDEGPVGWLFDDVNELIEMAGESSNSGDNYYYTIQLDLTAGSSDTELTIYFQFENNGVVGQSATIDNVTLTETP